jgi:AraC family transcriptional regulator
METFAGPQPWSDWVQHVIRLLDAAIQQLEQPERAAQSTISTIFRATSLLRKHINWQVTEESPDRRGRLLAWQARKVREYIDSHIAGPVLVSELCALVKLSEAHFSRSFKRTLGESPHAFVIRRRLEFATDYMLQSNVSLSDIALLCGFADQAHLCKHFRQAMGQTPAAWRRARRTDDEGYRAPQRIGLKEYQVPWRESSHQTGF